MISSFDYTIKDVQFSTQPSAKEMTLMDNQCFSSPWVEKDYQEMQKLPIFNSWLLEIPDVCHVGFLAFNFLSPELEILRLGVHPKWRKRGLAELILSRLEILSKKNKIESIWLEVDESNKPAKSLYYKAGFKEMGKRKGYFRNPLGNALLFKKVLSRNYTK